MGFLILMFLSGLFISGVAAYFSIVGLVAIFPGAVGAIICMGIALEIGKLVTATWVYRYWKHSAFLIRSYFVAAVVTLSFVTSIGIFGFLSRTHIEGTTGLATGTEQISFVDTQIATQRQTIDFNTRMLAQMDGTVTSFLSDTTKAERALAVRNSQKRERQNAIAEIAAANKAILALQLKRDSLSLTQRDMEVHVGPLKYVTALWYDDTSTSNMERMVRSLIILMTFVFDPLAILMLVGANIQIKEREKHSPDDEKHSPTPEPLEFRQPPSNLASARPEKSSLETDVSKSVRIPPTAQSSELPTQTQVVSLDPTP